MVMRLARVWGLVWPLARVWGLVWPLTRVWGLVKHSIIVVFNVQLLGCRPLGKLAKQQLTATIFV